MNQKFDDYQDLERLRRERRLAETLDKEETRNSAAGLVKGSAILLLVCGLCFMMGQGPAMLGTIVAIPCGIFFVISALVWLSHR